MEFTRATSPIREAMLLWDTAEKSNLQSPQQCPWGIKASLEQQVAELKVNTGVKSADSPIDLEDNRLCSAEVLVVQQNGSFQSTYNSLLPRSLLAPSQGRAEMVTGETWLSQATRRTMVTDAFGEMRDIDSKREDYQHAQKVETYIFGLIQRRALLTRPSKPRTSLAHDTQAVSMVRQTNLSCKEDQHSPKQVSVQMISTLSQCLEVSAPQACHNLNLERCLLTEFTEDAPDPCHHLQKSVQHQPGFCHKPRQNLVINTSRSALLDYPSCRVLKAQPESSNSERDSPEHFHNYPSPPALLKPHQPLAPDEQLVNAEYIPAQPCRASTRAYANHHSNPHKGSGMSKHNQSTFSPERGHHQEQQSTAFQIQPSRCRGGPKKCRSNEDRSGASRKLGKKSYRSQSENSLQRVPEHKYNTVERDGGGNGSGGRGSHSSQSRSKKQQQGTVSYRGCQSTLELSQDEADQLLTQAPIQGSSASNQRDHCARRTRKSRSAHAAYAYPHRNHNHHQHMEYQLRKDQVRLCQPTEDYIHPVPGESESSMSEADSPDSSSLSSDSDESGGLVWPQQLPPQVSLPSPLAPPEAPLQPKAFVKIKASHALKKKILRFHSGSLKVMTTV
uniref:dapper homolog 1-like isoform X2 n=1 Tax=Monopterus albus TaxID=43700 RepID=UPI0009B40B51|nr:dapper homolog 1-like isoform X2 [Monopterus albus]